MAKRIDEELLPSNYINGQKIYGADMNKIVSLLRDGVNFNKLDIDKMLHGFDSDYVFESETEMEDWLVDTTPVDNQVCFVLSSADETLKMFKYSTLLSAWEAYGSFSLLLMYERMQEIEADLWDRSYSSVWFVGNVVTGTGSGITVASAGIGDVSLNDYYLNVDNSNVYLCVAINGADSTWNYKLNTQGGAVRMRGAWDKDTTYYYSNKYQDLVSYGGATYYCKLTTTFINNSDPLTDTTHWGLFVSRGTSFRARGEWVPDSQYYNSADFIDVVTYLGDLYYCKISNKTTNLPIEDLINWGIYTEKGVSFRAKGSWNTASDYVNNNDYIDIVTYLGKAYSCKVSISGGVNNSPVVDLAHWDLFVDNTMGLSLDSVLSSIIYTLNDNEDKTFTYAGINSVTVTIPTTVAHGFHSAINYLSGATPQPIVFINNSLFPLKIMRYGINVETYTPVMNTYISLYTYCDGLNVYCYIIEVE